MFWRLAVALCGVVALILGAWGWYGNQTLCAQGDDRVFAYGTLTYAPVRFAVTARWLDTQTALLDGYIKDGLDVRPQSGALVEGVVFEVDERVLARLDRYERLGVRYERYEVELQDGTTAWIYRRIHAQKEAK